ELCTKCTGWPGTMRDRPNWDNLEGTDSLSREERSRPARGREAAAGRAVPPQSKGLAGALKARCKRVYASSRCTSTAMQSYSAIPLQGPLQAYCRLALVFCHLPAVPCRTQATE